MSAIFGILNLSEKPVRHEDLLIMQTSMHSWGSDGRYLWHDGSVGIGQMQLYNTPESVGERFPIIDNESGLAFAAACRIDNRDELFIQLDIPLELRLNYTDAQLMFDAYRKWGKDCVNKFLGDFSMVVINRLENSIFIARDKHGISSLYYLFEKDRFVFASSIKGILALSNSYKRLDEERLAELLVGWNKNDDRTIYKSIFRLPPAHALNVKGNNLQCNVYWELQPSILDTTNHNELNEAFMVLFNESVKCRLRSIGNVGSMLSSGLDSSAVSVTAANLLKEQQKKLYAFTSVPKYKSVKLKADYLIGDEGELASLTAQNNGNIEHFKLNCSESNILQSIYKELEIHDQPVHAINNAFWIHAIFLKAKEQGVSTMLTGQNGNATISWPTRNFYKRYINQKHSQGLYQKISNALPKTFKQDLKYITSGHYPWESSSIINPHFAKQMKLYSKLRKQKFNPLLNEFTLNSFLEKMKIINSGKTRIGELWNETGAEFGIETRDPFMDTRILEFCISLPDSYYYNDLDSRLLVKNNFRGIVPKEVLSSNSKGFQASDIWQRIENEKKVWQSTLTSFNNVHKLNQFIDIENLSESINNENTNTNKITRGIMYSIFINDCLTNN